MAKSYTPTEETALENIKAELRKVPSTCSYWFPKDIYEWVREHSKRLGVPEEYLSIPLLVTASHLSMHSSVKVDDYHTEELILYGLVGGDSGSNKSGSLRLFSNMVDRIRPSTKFDTGTGDGLRLALQKNQGAVIALNDEFSTFLESVDKTNGGIERSRVLNLYQALPWGKWTKTDGTVTIDDPRFNLIAFSQVENVIEFGRKNLNDGFFQRFLCACPEEIFVYREEQKQALQNIKNTIDMEAVLKDIYSACKDNAVTITLTKDADELYTKMFNDAVDFRKNNRDAKNERSIISKSKGMTLRIAGVIALMRESLELYLRRQGTQTQVSSSDMSLIDTQPWLHVDGDDGDIPVIEEDKIKLDIKVSGEDFAQAMAVIKYTTQTSMAIIKRLEKPIKKQIGTGRQNVPVPEPSEITMEYLINNQTHVRNILKEEETKIKDITRMKNYPNQSGGRVPALKFIKGLAANGLGKYSPNSDAFKRFHPEDESCPDRENLKRKWSRLCLD